MPAPRPSLPPAAARSRVLLQQGLGEHRAGRLQQAQVLYRQSLKHFSKQADALHMLGVSEFQLGRPQAAAEWIQQAIRLQPNDASAYFNYGNALKAQDDIDGAIAAYSRALELQSTYLEARLNRAHIYYEQSNWAHAAQDFAEAFQLSPTNAQIAMLAGLAHHRAGDYAQALSAQESALAIAPNNPEIHSHRGSALVQLGRIEQALTCYDSALALAPQYATAHYNRGHVLRLLAQPQAAEAALIQAIALQADYADAYVVRGLLRHAVGDTDAALSCFDQAITLAPNNAEAYYNRALTLLAAQRFDAGWPAYEWRLHSQQIAAKALAHTIATQAPTWQGEPGHDVLVLPEQGLGDQIFYAGMFAALGEKTHTLTVGADQRLLPLLNRSFQDIHFIASENLQAAPAYSMKASAQIHMGSLGQFLRTGEPPTWRVCQPYLRADPERTAQLRAELQSRGRLICGLSWGSVNADHGQHKSMRLAELHPLLSVSEAAFVNLQYGDTEAERAALAASHHLHVHQCESVKNLTDIDGLAALISACDVVVTISNSTAHLAAALGKPVLVMLPAGEGLLWYWHRERTDSPWYPSVQLLRQTTAGDWSSVIKSVTQLVQQRMESLGP